MIDFQVSLTERSSNKKTGPIPTSTTERASCPTTCAFYNKGCYAASGPQNLHWMKISKPDENGNRRGTNWADFCKTVRKFTKGQLWRHNVSGDIPHVMGYIVEDLLNMLVKANRGKRGYTYSHHDIKTGDNLKLLLDANRQGLTINASTESLDAADSAVDSGLPTVVVVDSTKPCPKRTPKGRIVMQCPATKEGSTVQCATCGLCAVSSRRCVVAFPAHGNAKKHVNQLVGV